MEKIIIVRDGLSKDNGGAITALLSLVNNIKDKFAIKFVFLYEDTVDKERLKDYDYECILPTFNISRVERKIRLYTSTLMSLNKILKKEAPDIVISYGSTSLTPVTILKKIRGYRLICSERMDPYSCNKTLSDKLRLYCYNYADMMVFQIPGARDYFNKKIQARSVVIPNPVDVPNDKWSLDGTADIAFVARMVFKQKRQDLMLKAYKLVLEKHPKVKLHLYGGGADFEKTKEMANDLKISNNVIFHGVVNGIKEKLIHHRLFVLTSDFEGMPNALLEAMSLGMPVISTDCSPGGAAFLIKNRENGLLVPRGDVFAIANAIDLLLSDDALSQSVGENARKTAAQLTYERNREEWLSVLNNVLR